MRDRVGAIVMAAGAGRRMGYRPKGLLLRDGMPLIERTARLLLAAGAAPVVVVLGHHAERIEPVLRRLQAALAAPESLQWVRNPEPDAGQGGSTRCGLAVLPADLDGVLVALADQPLLQAQDVRTILDAWAERAPDIELVLPTHQGQPGHPLVFGPAVRRTVAAGQADAGVREWRRAHAAQVQALPLDHARCTTDIDTEADIARLAAEQGVALTWAD